MGKLGCLLIIFAVAALFLVIVIPVIPQAGDAQTINNYLGAVLCSDGEVISRSLYSRDYIDGVAYSMDIYCVGDDNVRRDVTGTWVIIGMAGFLIPFAVGLIMMIFSTKVPAPRPITVNGTVIDVEALRQHAAGQQSPQTITLKNAGTNTVIDVDALRQQASVQRQGGGNKSLADRLKELQEARDSGLITYNEYDRMRDEIINSNK